MQEAKIPPASSRRRLCGLLILLCPGMPATPGLKGGCFPSPRECSLLCQMCVWGLCQVCPRCTLLGLALWLAKESQACQRSRFHLGMLGQAILFSVYIMGQ